MMKLWVGAEIQADVADYFRNARITVERAINNSLNQKEYAINLNSWDCIAVIRDDSDFEDIIKYSPKKQEMDFRLKIDYQEFKMGSDQNREKLIFSMLQKSLELLREKGVSGEEMGRFMADVKQIGSENHWLKHL
jgi:hypothetical protein